MTKEHGSSRCNSSVKRTRTFCSSSSSSASLCSTLFVFFVLLDRVVSYGGFFTGGGEAEDVLQTRSNIVVGVQTKNNNTNVAVHVQVEFTAGDSERFAWIIPVVSNPTVSFGSETLHKVLDEKTRPEPLFPIFSDVSGSCSASAFTDDSAEGAADDDSCATLAGHAGPAPPTDTAITGPMDYEILDPDDNGLVVFTWLSENGYAIPSQAYDIVDYYARQGYYFVALHLVREATKIDQPEKTQPIVLNFTIPGNDVDASAHLLPFKLTSLAALPRMPYHVFFLRDEEAQAYPVNYFTAELDQTKANWLECEQTWLNPSHDCFVKDMQQRMTKFIDEEQEVGGHVLLTEFAGLSTVIGHQISTNVNLMQLESTTSPAAFLQKLGEFGIPSESFTNSVIDKYITSNYSSEAPDECFSIEDVYQPKYEKCYSYLRSEKQFDPVALVQELNSTLIYPSFHVQRWFDEFVFATRFYGHINNRDPYFTFSKTLNYVSMIQEAKAIPLCDPSNGGTTVQALEITVGGQVFVQPVRYHCNVYMIDGPVRDHIGSSPVSKLKVAAYGDSEGMELVPDPITGAFSLDDVEDLIDYMDERVPDQIVPKYDGPTFTVKNVSAGNHLEAVIAFVVTTTILTVSILLL